MRSFFTFLFFLFTSIGLYASETIIINTNQYTIDTQKNLIVCNMDVTIINNTWIGAKTHIKLDDTYEFNEAIIDLQIGTPYTIYIPSFSRHFTLYFTQLPIININTNETIVDEPNVAAFIKIIESNGTYLESHIGIQYRGGYSQTLDKKSMEFEFWTDIQGTDTEDHRLLDLVETDSWNLQAMYNEPLRIRSKTNNDLWRMINTLHYQSEEPEAVNGIRMKYVELFINDEYRGVYCLGEKVNRKQLKLKKHNGSIRGELYKGDQADSATLFRGAPSYNNNFMEWSGFEYKHPKDEIDWSMLHNFVNFVVNSTEEDFYTNYENHFHIDNLVDYFIFLNLLSASDNTGKNLYIAKYSNNDKYFYVPWDLDGTFGSEWRGEHTHNSEGLLFNGFYDRVFSDFRPNGFRQKLKNKWQSLRTNTITYQSLTTLFNQNHNYLNSNGVYERESLAWSDYNYTYNDVNYMYDWINSRLNYLDDRFLEDFNILSIDNSMKQKLQVFPNPTHGILYLKAEEALEYEVTIYNSLGQESMRSTFNANNTAISLMDFNNGMYYVQIKYNNHIEAHKILLAK